MHVVEINSQCSCLAKADYTQACREFSKINVVITTDFTSACEIHNVMHNKYGI